MIQETTAFYIECDECKQIYYNSSDMPLFFDEETAKDNLEQCSEWKKVGDKYYCPSCYEDIKDNNTNHYANN